MQQTPSFNTEFDPQTHIGKVNGIEWPSVTQLIQEFGLLDFTGVPEDRLREKSILGLRVHAATVLLDKGTLDYEHFKNSFPECVPYLEAYRKFREIENFEPLGKEYRLFSKKWRFHGAYDEHGVHCGILEGRLVLTDYKCTWKMYDSTGPQLAGYDMLIRENAEGLSIPKELLRKKTHRQGLLLKPTGNYEIYAFKDPVDYTDMQGCIHLHWRRREHYKTRKGVSNDNTITNS